MHSIPFLFSQSFSFCIEKGEDDEEEEEEHTLESLAVAKTLLKNEWTQKRDAYTV